MDPCLIPCNNSWEVVFWVCSKHVYILFTKLLRACFLLRSQHSWHQWGTGLWHHQDWMDDNGNCASWNALFMSCNTDPKAMILQNHALYFFGTFPLKMLPLVELKVNSLQSIPYPTLIAWIKRLLCTRKVKHHHIPQIILSLISFGIFPSFVRYMSRRVPNCMCQVMPVWWWKIVDR